MATVEDTFTKKYVRKPLIVDAVRVTEENFQDIVRFTGGTIYNNDDSVAAKGDPVDPRNQYIYVRVHKPKSTWQTQARVGDWILFAPRNGFKVYNDRAFNASFDLYEETFEDLPDVNKDSETDEVTDKSETDT